MIGGEEKIVHHNVRVCEGICAVLKFISSSIASDKSVSECFVSDGPAWPFLGKVREVNPAASQALLEISGSVLNS